MSTVPKTSTTTSTASAASKTTAGGSGPTTLVAGEQQQSVVVQSQLATSTVDGQGATRSNLSQVVGDLGAAHTAHSGWLESETQKITEWGTREIQRLMTTTKGLEERLVSEAQAQQKVLEEGHKVELARLVQDLDAKKSMRLKELEDSLQQKIQAALTATKKDIAGIETEMNTRKMALMSQAQAQTAKDVDRLSTLAVEAKLVPSKTRTIIETNTETGTVIAVAGGGEISTGQASAQTVSSANIEAAPTRGTLSQGAQVLTGDIRRNDNEAKVGEGAIVNTMTEVTQGPKITERVGGSGLATGPTTGATASVSTGGSTLGTTATASSGRTDAPIDRNVGVTSVRGDAAKPHIDAAYGKPLTKPVDGDKHVTDKHVTDPAYNKHATEPAHKEGLLGKIKHAISGEPKTSDSSRRV